MGIGPNWSPPEEALLRSVYGLILPSEIAGRVRALSGVKRSPVAVRVHAARMGLDSRRAPLESLITIQEVAKRLQISQRIIYHHRRSGRIQLLGRGKNFFVDAAAYELLKAEYPRPPARSVSRGELMRRLGYGEAHSCRLLMSGAIRGVKRGGRWFVDADHLDQVEERMRRYGLIRLDLRGVRGMDANRKENCDYQKRRRRREKKGLAA